MQEIFVEVRKLPTYSKFLFSRQWENIVKQCRYEDPQNILLPGVTGSGHFVEGRWGFSKEVVLLSLLK